MNTTPSLFAECPLPGCISPVDDPRWPCGECDAALAGYIRPSAQLVTVEEATAILADRDEAVAAIYAERRTMAPLPEMAQATPTVRPGPQAQPPAATRAVAAHDAGPECKRNQLCWVCEERHTCRPRNLVTAPCHSCHRLDGKPSPLVTPPVRPRRSLSWIPTSRRRNGERNPERRI